MDLSFDGVIPSVPGSVLRPNGSSREVMITRQRCLLGWNWLLLSIPVWLVGPVCLSEEEVTPDTGLIWSDSLTMGPHKGVEELSMLS